MNTVTDFTIYRKRSYIKHLYPFQPHNCALKQPQVLKKKIIYWVTSVPMYRVNFLLYYACFLITYYMSWQDFFVETAEFRHHKIPIVQSGPRFRLWETGAVTKTDVCRQWCHLSDLVLHARTPRAYWVTSRRRRPFIPPAPDAASTVS